MAAPIKCKTLLGTWGLDFSITCLKSFVQHSEHEIQLEIFEDGTLTHDNKEQLLSTFSNCAIIDKPIRDNIVVKKLAEHPACLNYRNSTGYAQKLFDIVLYEDQDVFYIDSDILFLKKFKLPEFSGTPIFMSDTFNAYSFTPQEFLKINFPIFPYINSGIFYFPQKLYNLDFIEQLLNDKIIINGLIKKIPWLEQTLWAFLLAKSKNIFYFDHNQIVMAQQVMKIPVNENITDQTIAVHLVSSLRGHVFPELLKIDAHIVDDTADCKQIKVEATKGYLSTLSFAIDRLKKKWRQMNPQKYANYEVNVTR